MATSKVIYLGELRTECTHMSSGSQFLTDAPTDNNGLGAAFSPTDTVATALASCMITIMGIRARNEGWNIDGTAAQVVKVMASAPRRISEIHISLSVPGAELSDKNREVLETLARNCPVAKSLHPDIQQLIRFDYY